MFLRHWVNGATVSIYELNDQPLTIGRDKSCSLAVDDPTISATHAVIEAVDGSYRVKDLNSTNGVLYKGEKVGEQLLQLGDTITLGTHEFELLERPGDDLQHTLKIKKSWIPGVYYTE